MTEATMDSTTLLRDLVVRRHFAADVDAVWRAFTDSEQVMKWWGPEQFTAPSARMDVRVGGTSVVCMRSPQGQDLYSAWHYTRVVPGQRLEYTFNLSDSNGVKIDPLSVGMPPGFPREVPHVVTFRTHGEGTELVITEHGYSPGPFFDISKTGLEQCLDKLERALTAADPRKGG